MSKRTHAPLGPSSAARWLTCPASIQLCASVPDEGNEAAKRGTVCHAHLAARLGTPVPFTEPGLPEVSEGLTAEDMRLSEDESGWVDTAELYVRRRLAEGCKLVGSELRVPAGQAFGYSDVIWGTADVVLKSPGAAGEVEVIDAKFGFEEVDVEKNPQLLLYALGVSAQYAGLARPFRLTIVQPQNTEPVRSWCLDEVQLYAWREEQQANVDRAVKALSLGSELYVPSEKACRWCRGASECPALREQVHQAAEALFKVEVGSISPTDLGLLLDKADMVERAIKQVRTYALKALALGQDVPGWKRVRSKKHRKWLDPKTAEKTLSVLGPKSKYMTKPELMSPAQVEKSMSLPKRTLDSLAPQPEGDPVLATVSDPRPAIEPDFTPQTTKELPSP